ncbi:MAG: FtsK/SpoIIIE domain-containing protein [Oscillospiraceae bacterium]
MKEIVRILDEAKRFVEKRSMASSNVKYVENSYSDRLISAKQNHEKNIDSLETQRKTEIYQIGVNLRNRTQEYAEKKALLVKREEELKHWCDSSLLESYKPNPSRLNDTELFNLVSMLNESGLIAWIKRTFKIGGYSSRAEMAYQACRLIEDAIAFCCEKIDEIEKDSKEKENSVITRVRHDIEAENRKFNDLLEELENNRAKEKQSALDMLNNLNTSGEMKRFYAQIQAIQAEVANLYGNWGEYKLPSGMPEKLHLTNALVSMPDENGNTQRIEVPIWVNAFQSNVIVVTSSRGASAPDDGQEKLFMRKFLARILKTAPLKCVHYSIFDIIKKASSLERLVDVSNIATTDLSFELFTSKSTSEDGEVTADMARKHLREQPRSINRYMAGLSQSLFDFNKENKTFEYPFTWYVDFAFPETLSDSDYKEMSEIFINSASAGYSFLLLTSNEGLECVKKLTELNPQICLTHIDIDCGYCESQGLRVNISDNCEPSSTQIGNFVKSLKKYYEEGKSLNNRINKVFAEHDFELKDASKMLSIPMGIDKNGNLCNLKLGGDGSVHGFISGGTNSGKSTLLHTIILSACLHYSPDDLELWLVDYKETEFNRYKNKSCPHIKLIGISKTADFTFSLLDRIIAEAARRTQLMKIFDAKDLEDYRSHKGEEGYEHLTRLFIIIDEFHEMSQFVSDDFAYRDKLENVLREYRAQGINLLLADQTFSNGLSGLTPSAKDQISLRIAMRNENNPMEIKETLAVDRSLYTSNINHAISLMSQGDFIMKIDIRDGKGELVDTKLEKFKALHSTNIDFEIVPKTLSSIYEGMYKKELVYVNTDEKVAWNDDEPLELDRVEPIRKSDMRVYLGRPAVIRPCFGVDLGHKSDENLSIVGGTSIQRFSILSSIMHSCILKNYNLIVFMAEYSDLMNDCEDEIRSLCKQVPSAELYVTTEEWCTKLKELEKLLDSKEKLENTICMFIGLETQVPEFEKCTKVQKDSFAAGVDKETAYVASLFGGTATSSDNETQEEPTEFDASPIINKLFSGGAKNGIRCVVETSVYRHFDKLLKISDMCTHRIAFSMSADDCVMYLGSSNCQKNIGNNAVYNNGGKNPQKLVPYTPANY